MKDQIIKFYDDTNDYEIFEETKQHMFDYYAELEGWQSIDEITDDIVYKEINELHGLEWIELKLYLNDLFENNDYFIIKGTSGRWDGPAECGRFVNSTDELLSFLSHLNNLYNLYNECVHHLYLYRLRIIVQLLYYQLLFLHLPKKLSHHDLIQLKFLNLLYPL